jgi:hypothetical protein
MPPDHPPAQGGPTSRRELLAGLAMALQLLAQRILPQADTAHEVAELAARAEELAAEAWTLGAARIPDPARAAALEADFRTFIAEAADISGRAAQAAAAVRAVGQAIASHGTELTSLAGSKEADDLAALRTRLRPLLTTLEQLPERIAASTALAQDVAAMGANAARLGAQALAAQDQRLPAGEKALALYRSLRAIGQEAGAVAETLLADAQRLRGGIAGIASGVSTIATPGAPPASAEARLSQVVAHGAGKGTAPAPPAGLDWGIGRRG